MSTTFFDTHDYVKSLQAAGVPPDQAEAHAKALGEAMNSELVKKTDLNEFRAETKNSLTKIEGQFELLKWMMGFTLAGIVALLFKIFH